MIFIKIARALLEIISIDRQINIQELKNSMIKSISLEYVLTSLVSTSIVYTTFQLESGRYLYEVISRLVSFYVLNSSCSIGTRLS